MSIDGLNPGRKRAAQILAVVKRALWKKLALAMMCVVVVFWVAGCFLIYSQMRKTPEQFGHFMKKIPPPVAFIAFPFETLWMHARTGALDIGDRAPDFILTEVDHSGQVQLSDLNRTQPVVLIFGSYT